MSVVRAVAKAAFAAADPVVPAFRGPRILIYHQVTDGVAGRQMVIRPEVFERQMEWLAEHFTVVSFDEAIARRGDAHADHLVALTFDDGYRDTYEHAWPVLKRLGFPFTLYLTTQPLEIGKPLFGREDGPPLTWWQVEEMVASGLMTVGAHTHTHPRLPGLPPEAVEDDLDEADRVLQDRLGEVPSHFAYPWGHWSAAAEGVIRRRYRTAVLGSGRVLGPRTDLHRLPRLPLQASDGLWYFVRKIRGGMGAERALRGLRYRAASRGMG